MKDILEKYLKVALSRLTNVAIKSNEYIFKCNLCGDSKRNFISRGRIYYGSRLDQWFYHCFNGGCLASSTIPAKVWLQRTDKVLYNEYLLEVLTGKSLKSSYNDTLIASKTSKELLEKKLKPYYEKYFVSILKDESDLAKKAIEYCKSRKIPEEVYKGFFTCSKDRFKDRLIIPFYNESKVYYYIGRSLTGQEPKYLNKQAEKSNCLYNIFKVDRTKPVILCEGVIDSLFLENSVAILGVNLSEISKDLIKDLQKYFIFDDDEAGKKTSIVYLKNSEYVFLWKKFKKDYGLPENGTKLDINDCYIYLNRTEKFTFEELKKYFSNNLFDRILI